MALPFSNPRDVRTTDRAPYMRGLHATFPAETGQGPRTSALPEYTAAICQRNGAVAVAHAEKALAIFRRARI